jgi:DNA polymerase III alpha subunit
MAGMAYVPFIPLRVFSAYTMLEGAIEPKAIGETAKKLGFPAIAICDRNGLYGFGDQQATASLSATGCRSMRRMMLDITICAV